MKTSFYFSLLECYIPLATFFFFLFSHQAINPWGAPLSCHNLKILNDLIIKLVFQLLINVLKKFITKSSSEITSLLHIVNDVSFIHSV